MRTKVIKVFLILSILGNNTYKISKSNLQQKKELGSVVKNGFKLCQVNWDVKAHKPYSVKTELYYISSSNTLL